MTRTASGARGVRRERSRLARAGLLTLLAAAAALALLASACGGSSSEGVARVDTTETTTTDTEPADVSPSPNPTGYSACMRKNGVPKFPDPDSDGHFNLQGGPGLDPNSPQFKAAEEACEKFMPRGGNEAPSPEEQEKELQNALEHAKCMREHGVPNFPDPKPNAEGGLELSPGESGFDPSSPAFQAAEKACADLAPGGPGGSRMSPAPGGSGGGATP